MSTHVVSVPRSSLPRILAGSTPLCLTFVHVFSLLALGVFLEALRLLPCRPVDRTARQ